MKTKWNQEKSRHFLRYTSISDQDRISPNNINTMSQKHDENKGKYHIGDYKLIQH